MKDVTLNQREQTPLHVLNTVVEHQLPVCQAAEIMGVSDRHVWRMLAAYRKEGAAALAHGNRGRRPRNAVSDAEAAAVVQLASTTYAGANQTHLAELLRDREGIDLSRRTVHRILTRAGIPSPRKRRPPRYRVRRQRMPQEGMLVQVDGSYHPWLGKGVPYFTLLLAVDDATGIVVNAVFRPEEDTRGYFTLMEGLIQRWGIPLALYGDRHGVFKFSGNPRHIQPPVEATHFSRAMVELGIQQIFARSPQAKGRVERMAGTFQDRLVTELRLADARTIDRPTPCSGTSCLATIPSPRSQPNCPSRPIAPGTPSGTWPKSSASNTHARWPVTTRSSTSGALCSCSPAPSVPAMPECRWKSWNTPTAVSRAKSSPAGRRREPLTGPWLPPLNSTAS